MTRSKPTRCVAGPSGPTSTLCGLTHWPHGWAFESLEHARAGGHFQPCPECLTITPEQEAAGKAYRAYREEMDAFVCPACDREGECGHNAEGTIAWCTACWAVFPWPWEGTGLVRLGEPQP